MASPPPLGIDPLLLLPSEIVLRILDFTPVSGISACTRLSKAWHQFIDETHQDAIYSALSKTEHLPGLRDPSKFHQQANSLSRCFDGVESWKELCKRQSLLARNYQQKRPSTTETVVEKSNDLVWRFRPDFKRRIYVSTSQRGGLYVVCMDTHQVLWSLDKEQVRSYAHLEYNQIGGRAVAVFDRWGNALEVWRTVQDANVEACTGKERGIFELVAVLHHDCETRGYQLSHDTLCVVSTEGQGFIYDLSGCAGPEIIKPPLITHLTIETDAIGHLDQDADYVMYSLGRKGYHVHSKTTGAFVGAIEPWKCGVRNLYHIDHPPSEYPNTSLSARVIPALLGTLGRRHVKQPHESSQDRMVPIRVEEGPPVESSSPSAIGARSELEDDDWGAGMLDGNLMVGISRSGRIIIVKDWSACLSHADGNTAESAAEALQLNASLILCKPHDDTSNFDLGGWLCIHNNRILFEIRERIYILSLDENSNLQTGAEPARPSFACSTSSAVELAVPVSFMALYDDCVMHTYTTMSSLISRGGDDDFERARRWFPIKAIRALSFAPVDTARQDQLSGEGQSS
ncbi:hypothetical protein K431DRAFT_230287 [Polychaeton citri CBS 116435]|uniref:F-box domain-containing protein n=1 Tax=Polychaeton citri CBS 116435 TaxID=1314669 RepID=A0A9P4UK66_9PEZI|nr:hypothetical protein K431DRAFT_230287 [Polychaeton citri CBS 116435]